MKGALTEDRIFVRVIEKYFSGHYPENIERDVQKWLVDRTNYPEKDRALETYWSQMETKQGKLAHSSLKIVRQKIGLDAKRKLSPVRLTLRIAAVLIPMLVIGAGIYLSRNLTETAAPLATYLTATGGTVKLPDGSSVRITEGGVLEYPQAFESGQRKVRLSGEAYFTVEPGQEQFIVETALLTVKVTGTEFILRAYDGQTEAKVSLIKGSVDVEKEGDRTWSLTAGEELVLENDQVNVKAIEELVFRSGEDLVFENAGLPEILETLSAERGLNIDTSSIDRSENAKYTVKFSGNETPEEILEVLRIMTEDDITIINESESR